MLDLGVVDFLTDGRLGVHDVPCPACGPEKRSVANRRRRVLRIWQLAPGFATYHCARCGERGYTRDDYAPKIDRAAIERSRAEAAERERISAAEQLKKARWLWSRRRPLAASVGERYLREARDYHGKLPATLGFLPARGQHGPALIAAFGLPTEPEPGQLHMADDDVRGVHITRLSADGLAKAGTEADKIMIGRSTGWPIVVAPANDLLALAITEGIEDALSVHEATGLGGWAAGSASRMPALADAIPAYIESITIFAHADEDGQRGASELARRLSGRVPEVRIASAEEGRPG